MATLGGVAPDGGVMAQLEAAMRPHTELQRKLQACGNVYAGPQALVARFAELSDALAALGRSGGEAESAHKLLARIHVRLRARYGRHATVLQVHVMHTPMASARHLVDVLTGSRAQVQAAVAETDDPAVLAALVAALAVLDELHAIATDSTPDQETAGVSCVGSSSLDHPPPRLSRCTHHRRHLVATSMAADDPAPATTAGATTLRSSFPIGGAT